MLVTVVYIMYMYVNRRVELAQRWTALQKMYVLLILSSEVFHRPWTLKLHMRQWDQFSQTRDTQVMLAKWIISSLSQTLGTQVMQAKWIISSLSQTFDTQVILAKWIISSLSQTLGTQVMLAKWIISSISQTLSTQVTLVKWLISSLSQTLSTQVMLVKWLISSPSQTLCTQVMLASPSKTLNTRHTCRRLRSSHLSQTHPSHAYETMRLCSHQSTMPKWNHHTHHDNKLLLQVGFTGFHCHGHNLKTVQLQKTDKRTSGPEDKRSICIHCSHTQIKSWLLKKSYQMAENAHYLLTGADLTHENQ